jgi:tripartite-type tricarboxylate transporter receptor subunit TctC
MGSSRRQFLGGAGGIVAFAAAPRLAAADPFPSRPIRLVLPFPPGGVFDIVGRPWADKVSRTLGTVIVENEPGAGPIFLGSTAIHMADMILRAHPLINPMKDLQPISMLGISTFAIVVHPSVPAHSLLELVAYVKANPGKLSYGTPGAGTMNHLSGEMFKSLTGIEDLPHVPYRGAGPAMADLIAGQIPIVVPAMTNQVLEFHRTGRLRLLAITNAARLTMAPDIPTAVEAGVPGLVSQQVLGMFAPAATPADIVGKIAAANAAAMADKVYTQSLVDAALVPVTGWTPQKFDSFMDEEVARWSPLVKSIGVQID